MKTFALLLLLCFTTATLMVALPVNVGSGATINKPDSLLFSSDTLVISLSPAKAKADSGNIAIPNKSVDVKGANSIRVKTPASNSVSIPNKTR
jgi:hypothetical protein